MPAKNIWVREDDLPLFEKAEKLGGENLSAIIAQAVRRWTEVEEAKTRGLSEITLEVGIWQPQGADDVRQIRFTGRKLADGREYCGQTSDGKDRGIDWTVYLTAKGKALVHWKRWSRWQGEVDRADYAILPIFPKPGQELQGRVNGDLVEGPVPASILAEAAEAVGLDAVEVLDV